MPGDRLQREVAEAHIATEYTVDLPKNQRSQCADSASICKGKALLHETSNVFLFGRQVAQQLATLTLTNWMLANATLGVLMQCHMFIYLRKFTRA